MSAELRLAVDIGNTRTKWGVFDAARDMKAHGIVPTESLSKIEPSPAWASCGRAIVSNVAGDMSARALDKLLQGMEIHHIQASAAAGGVKNQYQNPSQLGSDRWASLVAAWHHYHAPCVVVSAGTAVTIDALGLDQESEHGVFLGGYILPGLSLMQRSIADKAPGVHIGGGLQTFPRNTADALYTGSLTAIASAVCELASKLQTQTGVSPTIVIAGGDAEAIHRFLVQGETLVNRLAIADNLVLQGLLILESEIR